MLRTFQAQNVEKIRTLSFGSASAAKLDALTKKECVTSHLVPWWRGEIIAPLEK